MSVAYLILPGGDPDGLERTIASIRAELGPDASIREIDGPDLDRDRIAGGKEFLAFARAGDRLVPGALEARLRTFAACPGIGISIAGHILIDAEGTEVRRVAAPVPGSDADEILLRRRTEPAAVLVRAAALDRGQIELLAKPHGDIVVWSRIAGRDGYQSSGESAAEIRLDPDRHGQSGGARLGSLIESVAAAEGPDREGEPALRRELLRRLYLAPEDGAEPVDLGAVFAGKLGPGGDVAAVIADLQWIAERQSEALRLERLRWAEGEVAVPDIPPLTVSEEILEAQAKLSEVGARMSQLQNATRRLEAEVYRRDAIISQLGNLTRAEAHGLDRGETEGEGA